MSAYSADILKVSEWSFVSDTTCWTRPEMLLLKCPLSSSSSSLIFQILIFASVPTVITIFASTLIAMMQSPWSRQKLPSTLNVTWASHKSSLASLFVLHCWYLVSPCFSLASLSLCLTSEPSFLSSLIDAFELLWRPQGWRVAIFIFRTVPSRDDDKMNRSKNCLRK